MERPTLAYQECYKREGRQFSKHRLIFYISCRHCFSDLIDRLMRCWREGQVGERELKMDVWLSIKERVHPGAVVPPQQCKMRGKRPWIHMVDISDFIKVEDYQSCR